MKRICVFCGSSPGSNIDYAIAAQELGRLLAQKNITLVYGGGNVGLMGEIASSVMKYNGEVIGIIPENLAAREVALNDITELRVVKTMHERKAQMAELAEGFIAMPGGLGTLEEFFEIWTWAQLGIHSKPIGLLNVNNYYEHLIKFLQYSENEKFINPKYRSMAVIENTPGALLYKMEEYVPPEVTQWISKSET